jgi:hypothetical protein
MVIIDYSSIVLAAFIVHSLGVIDSFSLFHTYCFVYCFGVERLLSNCSFLFTRDTSFHLPLVRRSDYFMRRLHSITTEPLIFESLPLPLFF